MQVSLLGYIQYCELLTGPDRIANLQYQHTHRVEQARQYPTKLVAAVAGSIQRRLSVYITAAPMAEELLTSRPYLSRRFKQDTGESLLDCILRTKIEEAKRLLLDLLLLLQRLGFLLLPGGLGGVVGE